MKITIVGGGSYRVLGIMRSTMGISNAMDGGEINLYDLNAQRSEAMGRMLMKTPEQHRSGCGISWGTSLEEALEGADAVAVIMPAGSIKCHLQGDIPSAKHGFINSDNVSPGGAFCAIRIAGVIMEIARKMEKQCPDALLMDFVNPVAVLSGMVNNHTSIRAVGLCAGFTNHLWDISRIFGKDEEAAELDVETAGINHLSFITRGTWKGRDLFAALNEHVTDKWKMCDLQPWWSEPARKNITNSVEYLVKIWRELGVLIFSTEPDGMNHLMHDGAAERQWKNFKAPTDAELDARLKQLQESRAEDDHTFQAHLGRELNDAFWNDHWKEDLRFKRADEDVFVRVFMGLAGVREVKLAASFLNNGAITGIKDRHVVEYTQYLYKDTIRPAQNGCVIPDVVHGMVSSLATHQTLLGDALATGDPKLLAHALLAYPIKSYTQEARAIYKDLFAINNDVIPESLRATVQYL